MSAVAVTALFIASTIIVSLAVIGGVTLLSVIERHFAIRAGLKRLDETAGDGSDGFGSRVVRPDNLKFLVHGRER